MNVFSGVFQRDKSFATVRVPKLLQFIDVVSAPKKWKNWENGKVTFCVSEKENQEKNAGLLYCDEALPLTIVGEALLYNTAELQKLLNLKQNIDSNTSALYLIIECFKKWGINCVKYLCGEFSFAIWDQSKQCLICARDHLGQRPLFYSVSEKQFWFSNRLQVLSKFAFAYEYDESWIVDYLQNLNSFKDKTVFKNIQRLLPGHILTVKKDGVTLRPYWKLEKSPKIAVKSIDEAIKGLRNHLQDAVRERIQSGDVIGVELSGGLDSTSIATLAQKVLQPSGRRLVAFTNKLPPESKLADQKDEWDKARLVSSSVGIKNHHGIDANRLPFLEMIERALVEVGYPFRHFFTFIQENIFEKAQQHDIELLLSGFGGDEVVSESTTSRYPFTLMENGKFLSLFRLYSRRDRRIKAFLKVGYNYLKYILRFENIVFQKIREESWNNLILSKKYAADKKVKKIYFKNCFYPPNQSLREKTLYHLYAPWLTERLETGYLTAANYGLVYSYPMLHIPLLEYYFHLPDDWKGGKEHNRWLIRQIMKDDLPEEILYQKSEDFGVAIPFYKNEVKKNFHEVKQWCLSLIPNHEVFRFIDRSKIEGLEHGHDGDEDQFALMVLVVMMAMFFDKRRNLSLYDV